MHAPTVFCFLVCRGTKRLGGVQKCLPCAGSTLLFLESGIVSRWGLVTYCISIFVGSRRMWHVLCSCPEILNSLGRDFPHWPHSLPPEHFQILWRALGRPRTVCIIGWILPRKFVGRVGQRGWIFFLGQPSGDCSIISRVKKRSQRINGVLCKVQESQVSPQNCSPSVLDGALLANLQLSGCTWNAHCSLPRVLLGVHAHNMLWAVACPGAPCMAACVLHACTYNMRTSSMLDLHQSR